MMQPQTPVFVHLSGSVRIVVNGVTRSDFGTSRNRSLLALLAMRLGSLTARDTAIELIWPEVDPEVGRNRLSTALVHLRRLLALDPEGQSSALKSDRTHLWLDSEACQVDVQVIEGALEEFERVGGGNPGRLQLLEAAFGLFRGPLAPEVYDDWILSDQVRFSEAVDSIARLFVKGLIESGRAEAARGALHTFKRYADASEADGWQDHVAIPVPPSRPDLDIDRAFPTVDGAQMDYGALAPDSPFYIERDSDPLLHQSLSSAESIVLVKGPRQIGKTSLLARGIKAASARNARTVFTDFQRFPSSLMNDEAAFYLALAHSIGRQIDLPYDFDKHWRPSFGLGMNLEYFVRAAVEQTASPLIWAIDEGDKLFACSFASDFYGLIRSFHNARAVDYEGPWSRLTIVISYATEAYLFIKDLNQSPFNVGRRVQLDDFSVDQVELLNERLGRPLRTSDQVSELMALVGGHPFLVRRSLSAIQQGTTLKALSEAGHLRDGPFGDHLNRILALVMHSTSARSAMRMVLNGDQPSGKDASFSLIAAGVLTLMPNRNVRLRNRLYRNFLSVELADGG